MNVHDALSRLRDLARIGCTQPTDPPVTDEQVTDDIIAIRHSLRDKDTVERVASRALTILNRTGWTEAMIAEQLHDDPEAQDMLACLWARRKP